MVGLSAAAPARWRGTTLSSTQRRPVTNEAHEVFDAFRMLAYVEESV